MNAIDDLEAYKTSMYEVSGIPNDYMQQTIPRAINSSERKSPTPTVVLANGISRLLNMPKEELDTLCKEFAEQINREESIKANQISRIEKYIESFSDEEKETLFLNFLKWEEKFEKFLYDERHIEGESNLICHVIEICRKNGKFINSHHNDSCFLSDKFTYMGYRFELYVGQGAFWRIKKGKKVIFQSA